MKTDEINRAIAEYRGLLVSETQRPESLWPDVVIAKAANQALTPDYCADINAVRSALQNQNIGFQCRVQLELEREACRKGSFVCLLPPETWAKAFLAVSKNKTLITLDRI